MSEVRGAMPERGPEPPALRATSDVISALERTLATADAAGRAEAVRGFWADRTSPLIEDHAPGTRRVTLLWQDAEAAAVLASINRVTHDIADGALTRIPGTDIWHATYVLSASWRGSYTITALTDAELAELRAQEPRWAMRMLRERGACDPRNPDGVDAYGALRASVCALDDAPAQPWLGAPATRGTTTRVEAPHGRGMWLHVPAGPARRRPLVVALDGEVWHAGGAAANAVDHLPTDVAPVVAMIDSHGTPARMRDLAIDGDMSREIVQDIVPWLRTLMAVSDDPREVVVSGESLGGLTALKTAFDHPDVVGAALAQSSSLWQHDMIDRARRATPVALYLTVGTREPTLLAPHRTLLSSGALDHHRVTYSEYDGGHDTACWRGFWASGVRTLLGASASEG